MPNPEPAHFRPSAALSRASGFTLIELLLVVGVIAILGGAAIVTVKNVREATRTSKLEADVAAVNAAIQVYSISGGRPLPGASADPQTVLNQLKTKASDASASTIAGLKGSTIDLRLKAEAQTGDDAATSQKRAIWNGTRFILTSGGAAGVKNFILDESLATANYQTEDRTPPLKTGGDGWVWSYTDVTPTVAGASGTGPTTATAGATPPLTAPTTSQLLPPNFLPPGSVQALINFDITNLTLTNPNQAGTSEIYYSMGGSWQLYKGESLTVTPNMTVNAYAKTSHPDRWIDSPYSPNVYGATKVDLAVSVSLPADNLTYAQAGGAMTSGAAQTPTPATVILDSAAQIPVKYRTSAQFKIYYTTDGSSPLTGGTAAPDYPSPTSIDVSINRWAGASTLAISAAARAVDTALFNSSPVKTKSISITPTSLPLPIVDPPTGVKATDLPVSIALPTGQPQPVGTRIFYTLNGTDPGNNNGEPASGTLYTGQFNTGAGTNGIVVVTTRAYGPAGYGQWFTPSSPSITTYTTITQPDGALVGSATLNGTFVGSLIYAAPASGTMNSISFNSGAQILNGNLYLPGTPTIRLSNGTIWSAATDSSFSAHIQGWEFDSSGVKTVQTTPRVIDENGSVNPTNYSITFNKSSLLEGKVIRRHDSPALPTIPAPPSPDSSGSLSLSAAPVGPLSASQYANITLNSTPVGDVTLLAGHYGNLIANNNTAFVLGDPLHPEITQVYSFTSLTLNSAADVKIVGKVIVTVAGTINLSSGSVLGNSAHPEWFQLQFSSGDLNANSQSAVYGQLVDPTGNVTFNAGSTFAGSVTAKNLTINSDSVVFSLPPIIAN